jgi:monoamine oxidase
LKAPRTADVDLIVVGAGAAGLGAALAARERGLAFRVLEAASRSGGRAWTDTRSLRRPFDHGCHWLHTPSRNPLRALADALGVAYTDHPPRRLHDGAALLPGPEGQALLAEWSRFEAAAARAHADGREISVAQAVDAARPSWPWFAQWFEHNCAASPDEVSVADLAAQDDDHDDRRVPTGYGALLQRAAAGIPVELDCPVRGLDLSGGGVAVETPRGRLHARAAVLCVSVGVLAAEAIAVRPSGWPDWKRRALEGVALGSSNKVALELARAAVDPELVDCFVHCLAEPPANVAWHFAPSGEELAVAYLGGAWCRELCLAGEAAMLDFARADLERRLGSQARRHLGRGRASRWDADPLVRGGYSYCRAGCGNRRPELAAAVDERVFFAGEACSLEFPATAHGAWLSGRAAVEAFCATRGSH